MWYALARFVIANRRPLLVLLFIATAVMGYFASGVKLSYEFSKAIPVDNPRYQDYQAFKEKFGDDGNLVVLGVQTTDLFRLENFRAYKQLETDLRKIKGVTDVVGLASAVNLVADSSGSSVVPLRIFDDVSSQAALDSARLVFRGLPFYRTLLHNPDTDAYLMGVRVDKDILVTGERTRLITDISGLADSFQSRTGIEVKRSGLPLIRTVIADRIQQEMKLFLIGSLVLSVITLLLFFRSFSTMMLSIAVVLIGVVWSVGVIVLCGYKITLLTALLPSLVVVIGIPNCIYFINKYHSGYLATGNKETAILDMVGKMGVVTLFCNIAAAIGFAVFAFTKSAILKEFGIVSGLSIMSIFIVSFILIPAVLSYLPAPRPSSLTYLDNKWILAFLTKAEKWAFHHKSLVIGITSLILILSAWGMTRLRSVGYIVDDLPKSDKIYTDLKFFEQHFKGVMPLEILVDTKKPNGLRKPGVFERVDSLSAMIEGMSETNRPLSLAESFRFFYQGFSGGDSSAYVFPNEKIVEELMRKMKSGRGDSSNGLAKTLNSFLDSNRQVTRISVGMKDVGTERLPHVLDTINKRAGELFDSSVYRVTLTGTSITFLEGSRFIIKGLKESIFWAFLLIALCMIYLFRSWRILVCSLIPNVIPLVVTAGIMGWSGVPLKPSTVLVFSVALGIAIDITIRFLVNYRQEYTAGRGVEETVMLSIRQTGLSIIYTSLVLIAGFIIFCLSGFGGTFALGWLTSVTLLTATFTNIILLPVLILVIGRK